MSDNQLDIIRRYCDTSGYRLNVNEKSILCKVLNNPSRYNGFKSSLFHSPNRGRDYRDTWDSLTEWQYLILIDPRLRIKKRYRHSCDGYIQDKHWSWADAWEITDTREIIKILQEIASEL